MVVIVVMVGYACGGEEGEGDGDGDCDGGGTVAVAVTWTSFNQCMSLDAILKYYVFFWGSMSPQSSWRYVRVMYYHQFKFVSFHPPIKRLASEGDLTHDGQNRRHLFHIFFALLNQPFQVAPSVDNGLWRPQPTCPQVVVSGNQGTATGFLMAREPSCLELGHNW